MAVDTHGIPIVLHIPGWQRGKSLVSKLIRTCPLRDFLNMFLRKDIFDKSCYDLAEVIPPTGGGADRNGRNLDSSYHRVEGELSGQIKIVTSWHAIGHPVSAICFLMVTKFTRLVERSPCPFFFYPCKWKEVCRINEGSLSIQDIVKEAQ